MKWDTKEPCESCPYRKDARLEFWHPDHFKKLLEDDRVEHGLGSMYACHSTGKRPEPSICAGWLLNQKRRETPNNILRLNIIKNNEAFRCFEQVTDGGHELYESIEEMVEANFPELLE